MTERLYYDNSYLKRFTAKVTLTESRNESESIVYLDKSAFYPTSGGQPFDTGTIAGLQVTDVYVDPNGDVAHVVNGRLDQGTTVECQIDWERRFDHMQQHTGEHMLAGCVFRQLNGRTIGLHLGHFDSSIDVELPGGRMRLSDEELNHLEDEVNRRIQADEPIRCYFPSEEELKTLPLRKAPTVSEHVRVVQIGDEEYCACGGTHTSTTGQVGLVKITDARPSKGKLRLTFLCGDRAFKNYRLHLDTVKELTKLLNADISKLPEAASEMLEKYKDACYKLNREIEKHALDTIREKILRAAEINGYKVVNHIFENLTADGLKSAASEVTANSKHVALLACKTENNMLALFACSQDVPCDMRKLLNESGGRGGGSAEFARGSLKDAAALETACKLLYDLL